MPAQFAHILLVNSICTPEGLNAIPTLMPSVRAALQNYVPFCRLGAASPDCPSVVGSTDATGWSYVMHYVRPADFVRCGIGKLLEMSFASADTRACVAWLFGYAAHVVADCTIHPVVEKRVGPYSIKKNRSPHTRCELDQDVFIFNQISGAEIINTDFLELTRLAECGVNANPRKLNRAVLGLWTSCLQDYERQETKPYVRLPSTSLTPNVWFATYLNLMENVATKAGGFAKLFGMDCRPCAQIDRSYIDNLAVPNSTEPMNYPDVFAKARTNIVQWWGELGQALADDDPDRFTLANANLDTGCDANDQYVCWS